jgi:ribokinase
MVQLVTVGELTLDDIVLPNGTLKPKVVGGGSLYSAVGAQLWGLEVGIHSVTGAAFYETVVEKIAARGIDVTGTHSLPGHGIEIWLLHESQTLKQQVLKLTSAKLSDLDAARGALPEKYQQARAFHLAPQSPDGHWKGLRMLQNRSPKPFITMDIQADAVTDGSQYLDTAFCSKLTAFLPSREEVMQVWKPSNLPNWMVNQATMHCCSVAVKMGNQGSLMLDPIAKAVLHVPAYPTAAIDTTGAGDAYCGGFLAGLVLGKTVVECTAMGTVSASFIVEAHGPLTVTQPCQTELEKRLNFILSAVSTGDIED